MDGLDQQDLFDVLAICFREDSYTELIAKMLQNAPGLAREFFSYATGEEAPRGVVRCETRSS